MNIKNLNFRLIISLLIIGLIPLFLIGNITYNLVRNSIEQETTAHLSSIADLKKDELNNWVSDILIDIQIISRSDDLKNYFINSNYKEYNHMIQGTKILYEENMNRYNRIVITDNSGKVIFSTREEEINSVLNESFIYEPIKTKEIHIENIFRSGDSLSMIFSSPIIINEESNEVQGIIFIDVNVEKSLFEKMGVWPQRGKTGETLLVREEEGNMLFLNELRHRENSSLNFKLPLDSEIAKPAIFAVSGNDGIIITQDYRGKEVLAAYRHINSLGWGFVAKKDTSEIFAPLRDLRNQIIFISTGIVFFIILTSFFISRSISRPIKRLTNDVNSITQGNLEIELGKSNIFEIQNLTNSLNRILSSLKLAILRTEAAPTELGIGKLIKEKEEAIAAKKESEDKYKKLYESSMDAIMILEPPSWKFTAGNPSTIKMFNVKDEKDFTSRSPWKYSPIKQLDGKPSKTKAKEMIDIAMKKGSHFFEWTHKRITGEEFPAIVLLTRFKLNSKEVLQATVRDFSVEKSKEPLAKIVKSAEEALKEK